MLDCLVRVQYFIKLNIITTFNKIHIRKGDEKYTAFYIQWGLFKYLIILYSIKNGPSILDRKSVV